MQRTTFFSIVTKLQKNGVHPNYLANKTTTNWNQKHYNSIPINQHGLGGKMQTAHAKQILLQSYNNLKPNQVQLQYAQKRYRIFQQRRKLIYFLLEQGMQYLEVTKSVFQTIKETW